VTRGQEARDFNELAAREEGWPPRREAGVREQAPSQPPPRPRESMAREAGALANELRERAAFERETPGRLPRLGQPVAASPTVRRLARELGVDLGEVPGTGPGGAVTEDDVTSHVRDLLDRFRRMRTDDAPELPDFAQWGPVEREPMQAVRRATARSVARSWHQVPAVTQFDRADITELEAFRHRYGGEVARGGGKLTVTAILVKVCAAALQHFPHFNASLDLERSEIVLKRYVHIGVAIDTPSGLLMPVLRNADTKGLSTIAAELQSMAERARARRIGAEELKGASFALTNLGGLGTTAFTPIVAWPQVAILSVGRGDVQPVWRDGQFVPRTLLPLGVTYDHRAVDGADAARFLRWIAETLEAPLRLSMEG
jgi:pyruvate dehydrogenase E2 component (dihydrolipoamide acetyltransferase)